MGKSYIIKYIAEMERDKDKQTICYEDRIQDIVMRFVNHNNGAKKGEKIKVWEQMNVDKNYHVEIKKDIKNPNQDKNYNFIDLPEDIEWRNRWFVSRKYYKINKVSCQDVAY